MTNCCVIIGDVGMKASDLKRLLNRRILHDNFLMRPYRDRRTYSLSRVHYTWLCAYCTQFDFFLLESLKLFFRQNLNICTDVSRTIHWRKHHSDYNHRISPYRDFSLPYMVKYTPQMEKYETVHDKFSDCAFLSHYFKPHFV